MPAFSISLWLTISASAGVSLLVWRWNCDRRIGGTSGRREAAILPCQGRRREPGCSVAAAVDLEAGPGLAVDALVATGLGRLFGHMQAPLRIAPAEQRRPCILRLGGARGGGPHLFALGVLGGVASRPPRQPAAQGDAGDDGPGQPHAVTAWRRPSECTRP